MLKKSLFVFSLIFFAASASFAQKVYTPEKGSAERAAILNALRVPVEKELKQKVSFNVDALNVQGAWAYLSGEPLGMDGKRPNYRKTPYWDVVSSGVFDNNIFALFKKSGGKWKVVTRAIGCTDVCYATWWKEYKAPKAIFPYTE